MNHDIDEELRHLFEDSASTIKTISPEFTDTVITQGSKRRRARRQGIVIGAAATMALVVGVAWQSPQLLNNSAPDPADTEKTTTQLGTRFESPSDWAATLPRGEDVRAAYAVGQTLYAGDSSVPITGPYIKPTSSITLYDPAGDGWLATVLNFGDRAEFDFRPQNGIIGADGTFTPFAEQPNAMAVPLLASPDGTRFAVGPDIRDMATGAIVESFHIPDANAGAWFDEGIVYSTTEVGAGETKSWIWRPGSDTVEISSEGSGVSVNGTAFHNDGNCSSIGPLTAAVATYERICEGPVISVSPSGELALTESFRVVAIASGEVTALPVPDFERGYWTSGPLGATTYWEDDGNVVVEIPEPPPAGGAIGFSYVRCQISTESCERASERLGGEFPIAPTLSPLT